MSTFPCDRCQHRYDDETQSVCCPHRTLSQRERLQVAQEYLVSVTAPAPPPCDRGSYSDMALSCWAQASFPPDGGFLHDLATCCPLLTGALALCQRHRFTRSGHQNHSRLNPYARTGGL